MSDTALRADSRWRLLQRLTVPPIVRDWLSDPGSLTARLRHHGAFRVAPGSSRVVRPRHDERCLLGHTGRHVALIREVILLLDDEPAVEARSVLPLCSLRNGNRSLANMGTRPLGDELYHYPTARRDRVWVRYGMTPTRRGPCWGRQSRFVKRGHPVLVGEYFLPSLWHRLHQTLQ